VGVREVEQQEEEQEEERKLGATWDFLMTRWGSLMGFLLIFLSLTNSSAVCSSVIEAGTSIKTLSIALGTASGTTAKVDEAEDGPRAPSTNWSFFLTLLPLLISEDPSLSLFLLCRNWIVPDAATSCPSPSAPVRAVRGRGAGSQRDCVNGMEACGQGAA
jgi:hypothetical protein